MSKNGTSALTVSKPGSNGGSKIEKAAEKAVETLVASIPLVEQKVEEVVLGTHGHAQSLDHHLLGPPRASADKGVLNAVEGAADSRLPDRQPARPCSSLCRP